MVVPARYRASNQAASFGTSSQVTLPLASASTASSAITRTVSERLSPDSANMEPPLKLSRAASDNDSVTDSDYSTGLDAIEFPEQPEDDISHNLTIAEMNNVENELDDSLGSQATVTKGWKELQEKIQNTLKKHHKTLSLSQQTQFMILINFATLLLKGYSRAEASLQIAQMHRSGEGIWFARRICELARHYQIFEELPIELRGGFRFSLSWLNDERVKTRVLLFLKNLPSGKVTPRALRKQVTDVIFPELGIQTKKPISLRTAQRWLIKLGWHHSQIKKGVYMDGHERADVVEYRNNVFLPRMEKYEAQMVHYDGPDLQRTEPKLLAGTREIIPLFHDESCFHANDRKSTAW